MCTGSISPRWRTKHANAVYDSQLKRNAWTEKGDLVGDYILAIYGVWILARELPCLLKDCEELVRKNMYGLRSALFACDLWYAFCFVNYFSNRMMKFVMVFFRLVDGWFLFSREIWETNESKLFKFHSGIPPGIQLSFCFFLDQEINLII